MIAALQFLSIILEALPFLGNIMLAVVMYLAFVVFLRWVEGRLLKKARTKKQKSNVEIFSKLFKYLFGLLLILFLIFSYSGSLTGLGLTVGLLSAALGFALQRPITGIAAWIMIVIRRPFEIGDRVIIGTVKGDVDNITLTHVYLREIGGVITSEENSGRMVLIPNSLLFEQNIINYTLQDDFVLDEVTVSVTYESDLDKAVSIAQKAAATVTRELIEKTSKDPYTRTFFQASGMNVHVRYFAPATRLQEFSSAVSKEIYDQFQKHKDVHFAYPHSQVILKK